MIGDAGWKVRHELIWVKDSMVFGRSDYHYQHEPILYGWKKDGKHHFYSDRKQTSVLKFKKPSNSIFHPTTKPIELIEYLIKNHSKEGDIVLDLCGGSGTTLLACERLNRICYMAEIDEKYCDVIKLRFSNFQRKLNI
jgi:DNA modification methylase